MLITSLFPLLALLVLPSFGRPVVEGEVASAEASSVGGCKARGDRTRWRPRPSRSSAMASPTSEPIASAIPSEAAATASPTSTIGGVLVVAPPTTSTAAPAPTTAPVGNAPAGDATTLLNLHNEFRAKYGASALTWNSELATFAASYASKCVFKHSGGPYGENLAAGSGGGYTATSAFNAWAGEASLYNWNSPGFSSGTGHFTQLVWKATTELGCAVVKCDAGTIFGGASTYVICEYKKPGNMVGNNNQYFRDNVGTLQG